MFERETGAQAVWLRNKMILRFINNHPAIFCIVLLLLLTVLLGAVEEYSRACKKEWGSKWEGNEKIIVYEFNGLLCPLIRWIDKYKFHFPSLLPP